MKPFHSFLMLAAIAAVGQAYADPVEATTTPVGYTTTTLNPSGYNFVGLTTQQPTVAAGIITSADSTSVTVSDIDFVALLGAPDTPGPDSYATEYVLELADGTIQEITTWNSSGVLTTPDDISSKITAGVTTFKLRKAATISDVFGASNSAGLKPDTDGNFLDNADLVSVVGSNGAAVTIYYYNDGDFAGWFTASGAAAENFPIVYADGFFVNRKAGSSLDLIVSGEVKTAPTEGVVVPGFNFMSSVAPVGLTVGNSGLQDYIQPDSTGEFLSVDNLQIPQSNGSLLTVYYYDDGDSAGWYTASGGDAGDIPLEGGFIFMNRSTTKPFVLSVPSGYATL